MSPKPFNSSTARKALDRIWSVLVKRRDGHKCQRCGYGGPFLESAHIYERTHWNVRWSLANGVTLCKWTCHRLWAHTKTGEFKAWALSRLTPEERDYLIAESEKLIQWGPAHFEHFREILRAEEKAMEAAGK